MERVFPTSFAQRRLWFLDQLSPGSWVYNLHAVLRLPVAVQEDVLRRTIAEIVRRHHVLRTVFRAVDGEPVQVVTDRVDVPLLLADLEHVDDPTAELGRLVSEEVRRPFDLARGPILRTTLVRLAPEEHVLVVVTHHIVSDGWSFGLLGREVRAIYDALAAGERSPFPELPLQYADFAHWQQACLSEEERERHLEYWRVRLAGLEPTELYGDRPRPPVQTFHGDHVNFALPADLEQRLRELVHSERATLFMGLLAGFSALLRRYTRQEDIVVGVPVASRTRPEFAHLIGPLINTLVVRLDCAGDPSFRDLLRRVRKVVLEDYEHQDLPFEMVVADLAPDRDLSRNPLFQVAFAFERREQEEREATVVDVPVDQKTSLFELALYVWESPAGIRCQVEYSTEVFEEPTIGRLVRHFTRIFEAAVGDPDAPLSRLDLLDEAELHRVLVEWNATATEFDSSTCVHELIQTWATATPGATALEIGRLALTYAELEDRSNRLAHHLLAQGIGRGSTLGVCLPRSFELIVAILAAWKSGAAYLPLDPSYPPERLSFMIHEAAAALVLTDSSVAGVLHGASTPVILLDTERSAVASRPGFAPRVRVEPADLAYVMFTSGSTGRPKGVMIEHRGLSNIVHTQAAMFETSPRTSVLQFASVSFDASIFEIVLALGVGGTLCLAHRESLLPGPGLVRVLEEHRVTTVLLPPSVLLQLDPADCPSLQVVTAGGEACPPELPARWAPHCRFFNLYGPTEATIVATAAECLADERRPPIGRPIANARAYVLDPYGNPVPIGVPGELFVGGVGVGQGYVGRPALTAERFVPDPFGDVDGARLYRTGDLVRWRPDGNLEFLGRVDQQVKVRGQRVELGEIEAVLVEHPAVREARVVVHDDERGRPALVAYVFPQTAAAPDELRGHLRRRLPDYMLPQAFVGLDTVPLTPNGKLDRTALAAEYEWYRLHRERSEQARSEVEEQVAGVYEEVLGVERVGRSDSFFDLGGHSLLATQVISRLRDRLGIELSLVELFQSPTVAALAHLIDAQERRYDGDLAVSLAVGRVGREEGVL